MSNSRTRDQKTLGYKSVIARCHFAFSGSGGVSNFTGLGFVGCSLSGTTYTLQVKDTWPQLIGLQANMALNSSYLGGPSGALNLVFNGSQVGQFRAAYTGSMPAPTGSGTSGTIDFSVCLPSGVPVAVPYASGTNWCYIEACFMNQGIQRG